MSLVVQKYGGTSVGSLERIRRVAERVAETYREGHQVIVVVSAMAGETDRLLSMGWELSKTQHQALCHHPRRLRCPSIFFLFFF